MREFTPEEIKNRLSNIGEAIGNIALEYITKLEKENAELKADDDARKFAMAMSEKVEKQLREENAELKEKLKPENCLKYLAKGGYVKFFCEYGNEHEQLSKAEEIIQTLSTCLEGHHTNSFEYEQIKQATAFLAR